MDTPGIVEPLTHVTPPVGSSEPDVLTGVIFDGEQAPRARALAFVQSHGRSMAWQASMPRDAKQADIESLSSEG
jgi:hypothetical protein